MSDFTAQCPSNLNQFRHRAVRDLVWVIQSPPLISGIINNVHWWTTEDCQKEFQDCFTALTILDNHPAPLLEHLSAIKNKRLGSYFEGLVSFWLHISPNYRLLQHNIQIIHENHTYGEIDFIIESLNTKKVIHLEVAVKFYLGTPPLDDAYHWFGTNTKDQLGKKFTHLATQQTQLTRRYPEKVSFYLQQPIDEKQCFIKGRLFYPMNHDDTPKNVPLTSDHLRGRWCYVADRDDAKKLIKLNKIHWLATLNHEDINTLSVEHDTSIETIDRAECFAVINEDNTQTQETDRIFYLPKTFSFPT